MQLKDIDGGEYTVNLPDYLANEHNIVGKSGLHQEAYKLLRQLYQLPSICQEIPAECGVTLYIDLFVPSRMLAVEVQGEQHFKFNNFFYKDKLSYYKALTRDKKKRSWCEVNGITLVELAFNEGVDVWRQKLIA